MLKRRPSLSDAALLSGTKPKDTHRHRIFVTLEDPSSSGLARAVATLVLLVILLSVVTYIAGTLLMFAGPDGEAGSCPLYHSVRLGGYLVDEASSELRACDPHAAAANATQRCVPCNGPSAQLWDDVETGCVFIFTLEYVARLVCCPAEWRSAWLVEPLNVIDVVAILPWYVEQVVGSASNTQVVRALRLLRIFRISKASPRFALLHPTSRPIFDDLTRDPLGGADEINLVVHIQVPGERRRVVGTHLHVGHDSADRTDGLRSERGGDAVT